MPQAYRQSRSARETLLATNQLPAISSQPSTINHFRFFRVANRALGPKPTDEANRCNLGHLMPKTLWKALYVGSRDMKLQCSPLKYGQFITKPCVSPQVFYGSRRRTRCVLGSEAFRTMEQTWESQSGGALESNDTVKTK